MVVPTQEIQDKIKTKESQLADLQKRYQASLQEAQTMRESNVKNPEIKSFLNDVTNEYNRNRQFVEGELKGLRCNISKSQCNQTTSISCCSWVIYIKSITFSCPYTY